jgi:DNA-binding MarR family transcriptional regulator
MKPTKMVAGSESDGGGRGPSGVAQGDRLGNTASKNQDVIRRFAWVIASINVHLEEMRYFWAKALGISGPQWLILMALLDLDHDDGVPVNAVSKKLHVDSSFVTTQSKLLEKKGFLRRRTSAEDARIVKMSLTDKTYKHLSSLDSQREALNEFIFAELKDKQISELTDTLQMLQTRLEKAILKMVADI